MTEAYRKPLRVLGIGEGALELEKQFSGPSHDGLEVVVFPRAPKADEAALFDAAFVDADRIPDWKKTGSKIPLIAFCTDSRSTEAAIRMGALDTVLPSDFESKVLHRIISGAVDRRDRVDQTARMAGMNLEFLLFVAHEIRGPLAIVKEGVTLVGDKVLGKINDKQEQVLQTAKKNIDRIDRLIGSMLNLSKLEAGRMELRCEPFDFMALVKETAAIYGEWAAQKGLQFRVVGSSSSIKITADRARVKEILEILLSNAFKFTERGSVTLETSLAKGELTVVVSDTGVGIPPEDLGKIFRKFTQLGWAPGGGEKGMGAGLAIARGIAGLHGGSIDVESAVGRGSVFTLKLPARVRDEKSRS